MKSLEPRDQAEAALRQAQRAAKQGDIKEAERWSKVAAQLAEAADKLAKLPPPAGSPEEEEALRTEIRSRIQRLIAASEANASDKQLEAIVTAPYPGAEFKPPRAP